MNFRVDLGGNAVVVCHPNANAHNCRLTFTEQAATFDIGNISYKQAIGIALAVVSASLPANNVTRQTLQAHYDAL